MAAHITLSKSDTTDNGKTYEVKIKMTYYGNGVSWNSAGDSYGTITFNGTTSSKFYHSFTTSSSGQTMGTKTFTVTKKSSSQTLSASGKFVTGVSLGTLTDSLSITIPALTKYTITYNANGGSGAPASQTKTYGTALTLSSTVPTKSGSTFMGWGTSSTATSASYQPGGTYSSNASITLYAIWSTATPTYVYFYNTGGSTLTYSASVGSTFTFPTPYRSGYTLSGWSTSSGGTVSRYGGETVTWTSSMPTTYYGIWTQSGGGSYYPPSIQSCSAIRGSGTNVTFSLNFTRGSGTTYVYLYTKTRSSSSYTQKQYWSSVSSSSVSTTLSGYATNTEYDVKWEVYDSSYGSVYRYDVISGDSYLWKSNGTKLEVGVPLYVQGQQITPGGGFTPLDAYPVGSIYISVSSTNPASLFGGSWQSFGAGRTIFGYDNSQYEFYPAEWTNGEKTHTLTVDEMPSHSHGTGSDSVTHFSTYEGTRSSESVGAIGGSGYLMTQVASGGSWSGRTATGTKGGGAAHNNLPPYIVVYMWKRIA